MVVPRSAATVHSLVQLVKMRPDASVTSTVPPSIALTVTLGRRNWAITVMPGDDNVNVQADGEAVGGTGEVGSGVHPTQPANNEFESGLATRVTVLPGRNAPEHPVVAIGVHAISAGMLVTFPDPSPDVVTLSRNAN